MRALPVAGLVLCLSLPLALAACDGTRDEQITGPPLVPLAVGNSWTYVSTYTGETRTDTFTVEITGEQMVLVDGQQRRAFEQGIRLPDGYRTPYRWLYGNEPGGLYLYGGVSEADTFLNRSLYLKRPARKGEQYPFTRLAYNPTAGFYVRDTRPMNVVTTDTTITVDGRALRCYGYRFRIRPGDSDDVGGHWDVYEYYSPGVGHVAEVIRLFDPILPEGHNSIKQQTTLIDYRVR